MMISPAQLRLPLIAAGADRRHVLLRAFF